MFETPVDSWYVWIGLAVASVAVFGVALSLPRSTPPDAVGVAETVDSVASSDHEAVGERDLRAVEIKVGPHRVRLRSDGGAEHATFAYGPVTPVAGNERLQRVAAGDPPTQVFDSAAQFERTVREARNRTSSWRPASNRLLVRRVSWGEVNVTLVDV